MRMRLSGLLIALFAPLAGAQQLAARADNPWLAEVAFTPTPGTQLPMATSLHDADGRVRRLGDFFDGRTPVAMLFGYYRCRRLCSTAIDALARAANLGAVAAPLIFVGIDPRENVADAAARRAALRRAYAPAQMAHWHFLLGRGGDLAVLEQAAGLRTQRDANGDIVHAAGVLVATPDGRVAQQLPGVAISPDALAAAIAQAHGGVIATGKPNLFVQLCSHYDPSTGRYSVRILGILQLVALMMAVALAALIVMRRRRRAGGAAK